MRIHYKRVSTSETARTVMRALDENYVKEAQGEVVFSAQGKSLALVGSCQQAELNELVESAWSKHAKVREASISDV